MRIGTSAEIRFDGRVAIVTGAGGGMGSAYASHLAARGARVVVNDLPPNAALEPAGSADVLVASIREAGGAAIASTSSITTDEGAAALVESALDAFGRVDIVINNAGISLPSSVPDPRSDWDALFDVHVHGAVNVLRHALPVMRQNHYGRVINITSSTIFGMEGFGVTAYGCAKAAVLGLTRTVARETIGDGIKVNAIMPTAYTRMTYDYAAVYESTFGLEAGEFISRFTPGAIADLAVVLASDAAPCTGEVFSVGGGHAARIFYSTVPGARCESPEEYLAAWGQVMNGESFAELQDAWAKEGAHARDDMLSWTALNRAANAAP